LSKAISGTIGPIFTIFLPCGRYLIVDYSSDPPFSIPPGTLPWQPILGSESVKLADLPSFIALAFKNIGISQFQLKKIQ